MTEKSKTLPRWAQWLAGLALLATALTAGGLSLAMNLAAGLAIGIAVAIAFGLSDVAKLLIPITCQAIGWNGHLRAVYAVASIVSVACAGLYLADQFGEVIAVKENAAVLRSNADQRIDDLRASLNVARDMAAGEAANGGCGPNCRALNDRVGELETSLSEALRKREAHKPAEAVDGKTVVIAGAFGTDEAATARGTSLTLIIAALVIGELCAHLAGAAAAMIGDAIRGPAIATKPIARKSAKAVASLKAEALATAPKSGTRAWYLARLERDHTALANRVAIGELSVYAACIEAGLRKAPKASAKWTKVDAYMSRKLLRRSGVSYETQPVADHRGGFF